MVIHCEILLTFLSEDSHDKILGEGKPNKIVLAIVGGKRFWGTG